LSNGITVTPYRFRRAYSTRVHRSCSQVHRHPRESAFKVVVIHQPTLCPLTYTKLDPDVSKYQIAARNHCCQQLVVRTLHQHFLLPTSAVGPRPQIPFDILRRLLPTTIPPSSRLCPTPMPGGLCLRWMVNVHLRFPLMETFPRICLPLVY
jgi:hypothetical protein